MLKIKKIALTALFLAFTMGLFGATSTPTATFTKTATITPKNTKTQTYTHTETETPTETNTVTETLTETNTSAATNTFTPTATQTPASNYAQQQGTWTVNTNYTEVRATPGMFGTDNLENFPYVGIVSSGGVAKLLIEDGQALAKIFLSNNAVENSNPFPVTATIMNWEDGTAFTWPHTLYDSNGNELGTKTNPVISDALEGFTTFTTVITTNASGYFYNYILTPTADTYISFKSFSWKTEAVNANGIFEIKLPTSAKIIEHGFLTSNIFAWGESLHIEGQADEPVAISITSGGNAKDYFVTITYKEE